MTEIETYFKTAKLPEKVDLDRTSVIVDVPKFVDSHLSMVRSNEGKPWPSLISTGWLS